MRADDRSVTRAVFLIAVGACWFSAGLAPYEETVRRLLTPNDFTPDYVVAATWVQQGRCARPWPAVLERATANAHAAQMGAPKIPLLGPYLTHPPTALLPVLPLVPLGYTGAVVAWLMISVGLLAVVAWVVGPIVTEAGWPLARPTLFLLLLLWPPSLACFQLGQWSIALAATMALSHRAWERGRRGQAASWLAVAAALKVTPVLVAPALAIRDRRAGLRFVAVLLALVVVCLPLGGIHAWVAMFREAGPNARAWQTFWDNTTSVNGLVARLFVGGMYVRPLVAAPALAAAVRVAVAGTLLGLAAWASWSFERSPGDRDREGCVLALWYLLPPMLNPLGWSHQALLLVLPAALAARSAAARNDRLAMGMVAAAVALASFSKYALYNLAAPFPSPPHRSVMLSMHLYAGLLLFAAAAAGALRRIDKPAALK